MKIAYVATDNSIFYTEADCKKHEESLRVHPEKHIAGVTACAYNNDWSDSMNPSDCECGFEWYPPNPEDNSFAWFKADSEDSLCALFETFRIALSDGLRKGLVGKWMCFADSDYDGIYYECTLEDTIERFRSLASHLGYTATVTLENNNGIKIF